MEGKSRGVIPVHTILLVDDSSFMRQWIKDILHETNNYKVIAEASNGREALLQYNSLRPDIVIMDITMDEMNGIQALRLLVKLYPGIKVVMCSSLGQNFYIDECLKIGAKAFFVKSNFKDLIKVLEKVVN